MARSGEVHVFRFMLVFGGVTAAAVAGAAGPDFATQIQPVLEQRCYACHGPDARKGGLRLSDAEGAALGGDSGRPAIVPGDSSKSLMIELIESADDTKRMPLNKPALPADEIALLKAWIDAGASWGVAGPSAPRITSDHWAFQVPKQTPPPAVKNGLWVRNPIDRFVLARIESEGLAPAPEADRYTLIRRASLDLTGLPPSPAEIEAFANDASPDAYERLIDRLLASPHYGEKMAIGWLDAARYADSNGYEKDRWRSIWPYRDWVIRAFNQDLAYDEFIVEQLAGDLLPNTTLDQRIATGFHCNTMLNEEGGVDVEEFRYEAVVDRVNTTATVFLGLTLACAQCHTHKFDPITQREYFQFMAFLNNTDDLRLEIPDETIAAQRAEIESKIADIVSRLEREFPEAEPVVEWATVTPTSATASGGVVLEQSDDAIVASAEAAEKSTYTIAGEFAGPRTLASLKIEALTAEALPGGGPGLADNGNFVLSEVRARIEPADGGSPVKLRFGRAESDHSQPGFAVEGAIDGKRETGWAIDGAAGGLNQIRSATFWLIEPVEVTTPARLVVELEQDFGGRHLLGRFRIAAGFQTIPPSTIPAEERRAAHFAEKFSAWQDDIEAKAVQWRVAQPIDCVSNKPTTFRTLPDGSLLASGDIPNTDTYTATFRTDIRNITGIRIEVLPHASLPNGGPGRGVIMAEGDFLLSEVAAEVSPWTGGESWQSVTLQHPSHSYAAEGRSAALTLDGKLDTGWAIKGKEGRPHQIVYGFAEPVGFDGGTMIRLKLDQYYVHQHTIGRLRVSVTSDAPPIEACGAPADVEAALIVARESRTPEQAKLVKDYYLSVAPELAKQHKAIDALRASMPKFPATLVLAERDDRRTTQIHHRGEFLSPREAVSPGVPAVLPPLPEHTYLDRMALAKWIASEENPLTARVMVNRLWDTCFGRTFVNTTEDFGLRGEVPTHPELLDWLAVEFMRRGWSVKEMLRLIVTSATYRQSSVVPGEKLAADPQNELYARGPRFRVDAEIIRDLALSAGGLLNPTIGGPSVYPPLPEGTLMLVYPGQGWNTSTDANRYRRGIYTALKRTLPYPAATTFDAPARDVTCVRRNRSNTPLQSLTLLNDSEFFEAARAMARRVIRESSSDAEGRISFAFMLATGRPPDNGERAMVHAFYKRQQERYDADPASAKVAAFGSSDAAGTENVTELAAWTLVCRVLLNLDEAVTKG